MSTPATAEQLREAFGRPLSKKRAAAVTSMTRAQWDIQVAFAQTEAQFEQKVRGIARRHGWLYYHTYISRGSDKGFLDCVFLRAPRAVVAELKRQDGIVTADQQAWLDGWKRIAGVEVPVFRDWDDAWRPVDLDAIEGVLR